MPLYEYHCNQCGQEFEKVLRFDQSDELPVCPVCHSSETQKRISVFASLGGGSGFTSTGTESSSCSGGRGGFT